MTTTAGVHEARLIIAGHLFGRRVAAIKTKLLAQRIGIVRIEFQMYTGPFV